MGYLLNISVAMVKLDEYAVVELIIVLSRRST